MRLTQRRKQRLARPCACDCDRSTPSKKHKKHCDVVSDSSRRKSSVSSGPPVKVSSGNSGGGGDVGNELGLRRSSRIRRTPKKEFSPQSPMFDSEDRKDDLLAKRQIHSVGDRRSKRLRSPSHSVDAVASVDWDLRLRSRLKQVDVEETKESPDNKKRRGRPRQGKRKLLREIDESILRLGSAKDDSQGEKSKGKLWNQSYAVDMVVRDASESDDSSSSDGFDRQALQSYGKKMPRVNNRVVGNGSCSRDLSTFGSRDHSPNNLAESKEIAGLKESRTSNANSSDEFTRTGSNGDGNDAPGTMALPKDQHVNVDAYNNDLGQQERPAPTVELLQASDPNNRIYDLHRNHDFDESHETKNQNTSKLIGDSLIMHSSEAMGISEVQGVSRRVHSEVGNDTGNNNVAENKSNISLANDHSAEELVVIGQEDCHLGPSNSNAASDNSTETEQVPSCIVGQTTIKSNSHVIPPSESENDHDQLKLVDVAENQAKASPPYSASHVDEKTVAFAASSAVGSRVGVVDMVPSNVSLGSSVGAALVENGKEDYRMPASDNLHTQGFVEGRRCGLCGCGVDGKPPKRLSQDSVGSDNELYGLLTSEEPNYNIWDGFGDEPGWLGKLLGPIHDRFGIAGVWVHQHCAVWSPEVYFSGVGCLKNVRAALCRGRSLKCSRCGRPGATIGCRVDRCPKTYHLPCGRADGCVFDHRKFLIACTDHLHYFQPQGDEYVERIKKMKAKKMWSDMRKVSADARRKDLEAEEKWLENCGEDEEFLKREGRRLHRDISRILPIYIGGSGGESLYEGWESVAGLKNVIQSIKEVVILPLLYPEYYSNLGLTPPRGVLLHGYPGTGKTHVVRALVGACSRGDRRIAYFARKGADCLGKYVGDAERQLRLLFHVAEKCQPSIIFFDEIDGLTPIRSRQQDQTHSSVVSTLLALLDGLKSRGSVIVIGATNRPDSVDPALRRPGRFDREIYFPLPSLKDRSAILALHTQKWPKPASGSLLWKIAGETAGFAGADLQALCTQAAMIALKRNCPFQEILAAAEKCHHNGKRISLPSFAVEEKDWLTALACVSPPCSRREAGIAANHVITSSIQGDLVLCLLKPLVQLLVSLYLDECTVLPPLLYKAGKSITDILVSALEKKKIPSISWWSNLCYLLEDPSIISEIEMNLSSMGLFGGSIFNILEKQKVYDVNIFNASGKQKVYDDERDTFGHLNLNAHLLGKKKAGLRLLIAGSPRSGQKHLASCVLHGFEGNVEIHKVNLATMLQEGRGDAVQGITNIFLKCQRNNPCIIYMPRIDLWAIDNYNNQAVEKDIDCTLRAQVPLEKAGINVENNVPSASEAWNSLEGQIDLVCSSVIILATCEMPNQALPLRVRNFFKTDTQTVSRTISVRRLPHYLVSLDGEFNWDVICDASAEKLSKDLVCIYLQIIHNKRHPSVVATRSENFDAPDTSFSAERCLSENQTSVDAIDTFDTSLAAERCLSENQTSVYAIDTVTHREKVVLRCSENDLVKENAGSNDKFQLVGSAVEQPIQSCQDTNLPFSSRRPTIKMKSTLQLAIATIGFQILTYPHFAELCWVTSKLKEGPCIDTSGPWKGWPFNSCIARPCGSPKAVGLDDKFVKHRIGEHNLLVRGLVAVGLLAYRGAYSTIKEVVLDVRKVLEVLVGQIRDRIVKGKDRYRFVHLLSQVAYLEDMVNTWAYSSQRLEQDGQILGADSQTFAKGNSDTYVPNRSLADESCLAKSTSICQDGDLNVNNSTLMEDLKELNPVKIMKDSLGAVINSNANDRGVSEPNIGELASDERQMPMKVDMKAPSDPISLIQSNTTKTPIEVTTNEVSEADDVKLREDGASACEILGGLDFSEQSNAIGISNPSCRSKNGNSDCADVSIGNAEPTTKNFILSPGSADKLCLYECCTGCLVVVHRFVREYLMAHWKSAAHSTVEDAHEVVASCSASLLAMIAKSYADEANYDVEDAFGLKVMDQSHEPCVCQKNDKRTSSWFRKSGELVPIECSCHLKDKNGFLMTNAYKITQMWSRFKVLFKDYALFLTELGEDGDIHCKFANICLCPLIRLLLDIKNAL